MGGRYIKLVEEAAREYSESLIHEFMRVTPLF